MTYEERLERILAEKADPPTVGIFPVDARRMLGWDEVEEDLETVRSLHENPYEQISQGD